MNLSGIRYLIITVIFGSIIFFFLDFFIYGELLWRIPDVTAWETEPHYRFEYEVRKIERERSPDDVLVLVVGSSVARYGILPEKLEAYLNSTKVDHENDQKSTPVERLHSGGKIKVRFFAHQGMTPAHLSMLRSRILDLKPDMIVYPIGMVDFRLERPLSLGLMDDLYDSYRRKEALGILSGDLSNLYDYGSLSPYGLLENYGDGLNYSDMATLYLKIISRTYRYRELAPVGLRAYINGMLGSGKRYDRYAGIDVGGGGVNHRGWTGRSFSITMTSTLLEDGILMHWPGNTDDHRVGESRESRQVKEPDGENVIHGNLYIRDGDCNGSQPGMADKSRDMKSDTVDADQTERLNAGWNRVFVKDAQIGDMKCFIVEPSIYNAEFDEFIGVRLTQYAGLDRPGLRGQRPIRREDIRYSAMTEKEYLDHFRKRLLDYRRPGMAYLKALKEAHEVWGPLSFDRELPAAVAFTQMMKVFRANRIPVLLISAPENPVAQKWYGDNRWIDSFHDYLKGEGVKVGLFMDFSDLLSAGDFYDYHHPGYNGARIETDRTGKVLRSLIEND